MSIFSRKPKNDSGPTMAVTGTAGSLREFVYLDEISVYSLTSSPDMPPPVAMSQSLQTADGATLSSQVEGGSPLLAKGTISGELNSNRSKGLEIQRQFNIQSQFAGLHRLYRPNFRLRAKHEATTRGRAAGLADALDELEKAQLATRAVDLTRGALAEIRVALRAHHMFDVTVFMNLVSGLIKNYPDLLQIRDQSELHTAMEAGQLLAELMEDLVPIEGVSTDYEIVTEADGTSWVADTSALTSIWNGEFSAEPLRVVGVAEESSFWKDTRRILHAEAEFDILGRISRSGLQDEWTPVKMIDTFKRVIPSAADTLLEAVEGLRDIPLENQRTVGPAASLVLAGMKLNLDLARHHGVEASEIPEETVMALCRDGTLEEGLSALHRVADDFYTTHAELARDEDTIGALRQAAWLAAHAAPGGQTEVRAITGPRSAAPVLEMEFIAMYW